MSPPTPGAPHVRGRPPGDTGYGMYPAHAVCACVCVCVCVPTQVCVHGLEVHGVACVSVCSSLTYVPPTSTLMRSQVNFLNLLKLLCVHLRHLYMHCWCVCSLILSLPTDSGLPPPTWAPPQTFYPRQEVPYPHDVRQHVGQHQGVCCVCVGKVWVDQDIVEVLLFSMCL